VPCVFAVARRVALGITVSPQWFPWVLFILFGLFLVPISLLNRNWPTGIRVDESGISIGAIGSAQAVLRRPTVNHQSWGLFTCPWSGVQGVRLVTDRAELRQMKNSPSYYTLTNRWGGKAGMTRCNIGVLASPFMGAALVIEVNPSAVTAVEIRPARYYSNFKDGRLSHLIRPQLSSTWVAPTRHPEALRAALQLEPLRLVSREDPVDGVRRQRNAELNPRRPIPLPPALHAGTRVVPGRRRQRRRVPPQHQMTPVVRREDIKQPGNSRLLELLATRRTHTIRPVLRQVGSHARTLTRYGNRNSITQPGTAVSQVVRLLSLPGTSRRCRRAPARDP
jgi:hypothetical protein